MFFQPLRLFHSAFMSALILFVYLWLFYQSANTPLRDASVAALLPAAASSFTMVALFALSVTALLSLLNTVFRDAKVAGWFARLITAPLLFITALLIIENGATSSPDRLGREALSTVNAPRQEPGDGAIRSGEQRSPLLQIRHRRW